MREKTKRKKWESLYEEALQMAREGRGSLYDRVRVLVRVFEDTQFKADMMQRGTAPGVFLNEAVNETFTTFTELYALLKAFPEKSQWAGGNLRQMRESLEDQLRDKERQVRQEAQRNKEGDEAQKLSWKERYLDLESRYRVLEGAYKQLEKDHRELQKALGARRAS